MSMHGAMFFKPSENLDLRGCEDPFKNSVQLINTVPRAASQDTSLDFRESVIDDELQAAVRGVLLRIVTE
jgi:hypothetical protein